MVASSRVQSPAPKKAAKAEEKGSPSKGSPSKAVAKRPAAKEESKGFFSQVNSAIIAVVVALLVVLPWIVLALSFVLSEPGVQASIAKKQVAWSAAAKGMMGSVKSALGVA